MITHCGFIAILGEPNAGKSTLMNALLGEKLGIVTNKPQTTRKSLKGIFNTPTSQLIFLDTPGIHRSTKLLNKTLNEEVERSMEEVDVVCLLAPVNRPFPQDVLDLWQERKRKKTKSILVVTKIDLPLKQHCLNIVELRQTLKADDLILISALNGEGLEELRNKIESFLPEGPALYPEDELTDTNMRDLVAEIIREKAMEETFEEIPYSTAVVIESFKEEEKITRITAILVVEQDSQKGMVIGAKGVKIKAIGTKARADIESLVGTKVFLELRVKVDKNWTKDPQKLKKYGYGN